MGGNTEGFRSGKRGTVVNRGGSDTHKLPGATGCILSNSSLRQGQILSQHSSEDGQCIHKGTRKPPGRNTLKAHEYTSYPNMEVVHRPSDRPHSGTPSGQNEPSSRHRIMNSPQSLRLDAASGIICSDPRSSGPSGDRSICVLSNSSTSMLLQLEARPGSRGNRRVHSELEPALGICEPPWCLLLATLVKILRDSARVIMVAPLWKTQPW